MTLVRILAGLLLAAPAAAREAPVDGRAAGAPMGQVALTFDDLPALTILPDQPYIDYLTTALLRGLRRHHAPAIGFVVESKLAAPDRARQIADLDHWLDAGMDLGNHSFSHGSPNQLGTAGYVADIARGASVTSALLARHGKAMRWYRHPYLETGSPLATRQAIDTWLQAHGYRTAPVTIDADDWEFAEPYDDAIARHDAARRRRIRAEYLDYTARRIAWSQASARLLFGRDIAHVMLLHASRLNADTFDDLAKLLARARLRPVSLATALDDPAYRTHDDYAGKNGINWLERWALTLRKTLPTVGDVDPPKDIQRDYDRVDNDRR